MQPQVKTVKDKIDKLYKSYNKQTKSILDKVRSVIGLPERYNEAIRLKNIAISDITMLGVLNKSCERLLTECSDDYLIISECWEKVDTLLPQAQVLRDDLQALEHDTLETIKKQRERDTQRQDKKEESIENRLLIKVKTKFGRTTFMHVVGGNRTYNSAIHYIGKTISIWDATNDDINNILKFKTKVIDNSSSEAEGLSRKHDGFEQSLGTMEKTWLPALSETEEELGYIAKILAFRVSELDATAPDEFKRALNNLLTDTKRIHSTSIRKLDEAKKIIAGLQGKIKPEQGQVKDISTFYRERLAILQSAYHDMDVSLWTNLSEAQKQGRRKADKAGAIFSEDRHKDDKVIKIARAKDDVASLIRDMEAVNTGSLPVLTKQSMRTVLASAKDFLKYLNDTYLDTKNRAHNIGKVETELNYLLSDIEIVKDSLLMAQTPVQMGLVTQRIEGCYSTLRDIYLLGIEEKGVYKIVSLNVDITGVQLKKLLIELRGEIQGLAKRAKIKLNSHIVESQTAPLKSDKTRAKQEKEITDATASIKEKYKKLCDALAQEDPANATARFLARAHIHEEIAARKRAIAGIVASIDKTLASAGLLYGKDSQQYKDVETELLKVKADVLSERFKTVETLPREAPVAPIVIAGRPTTIEAMSRLEGWEPHGFYKYIKEKGMKYQMQYKFIGNDAPEGRTVVDTQPMSLSYEEHYLALRPLPGFHGYLLDAIRRGKRTATTRSYLINVKVGDVIKFWGPTGFAYCEITMMPYDITGIAPPIGEPPAGVGGADTEVWERKKVAEDSKTMYIFTDNLNRTSGGGIIPDDCWYSRKYGTGKKFPNKTLAVIRGLPNAFPICTMKTQSYGQWADADFALFKSTIDNEIATIIARRGFFTSIKVSTGATEGDKKIGQGSISKLPEKLQNYLDQQLLKIGINQVSIVGVVTGAPTVRDPAYRYLWGRTANLGEESFECSSQGNKEYSALNAKFKKDGETVEQKYHFDVKGYRKDAVSKGLTKKSWDCLQYKGKPAINGASYADQWNGYKRLWVIWAKENPEKMNRLREEAYGKRLTDKFANSTISQARALCEILNGDLTYSVTSTMMPDMESLPRQPKDTLPISEFLKEADRKQTLAKVSMCNKFIGFGEGITDDDGVNKCATEHYRMQAAKLNLANTGSYTKKDTVFVSIPGNWGYAKSYPNIYKTLTEVGKAIAGGAIIVSDSKSEALSSDFNIGEQKLIDYLTAKGVSYTEVIRGGCLIGVWNKSKDIVLPPKGEFVSTISNDKYHNRKNDKARVNRLHRGLLPETGSNEVEILDKQGTLLAVGFDRMVYGDNGPFIEINISQLELASFMNDMVFGTPKITGTAKIKANPGDYFHVHYSPAGAKLYMQMRSLHAGGEEREAVSQAPARSKGGSIHTYYTKLRPKGSLEGYADYIPGKYYISPDDVIVRRLKQDAPMRGLVAEDLFDDLISDIGSLDVRVGKVDKELSIYESWIFCNMNNKIAKIQGASDARRKPPDATYADGRKTPEQRRKEKMPKYARERIYEGAVRATQQDGLLILEGMQKALVRAEELKKRPDSDEHRKRVAWLTVPLKAMESDKKTLNKLMDRLAQIVGAPPVEAAPANEDIFMSYNSGTLEKHRESVATMSALIESELMVLERAFNAGEDTTVLAREIMDAIAARDKEVRILNNHNVSRINACLKALTITDDSPMEGAGTAQRYRSGPLSKERVKRLGLYKQTSLEIKGGLV